MRVLIAALGALASVSVGLATVRTVSAQITQPTPAAMAKTVPITTVVATTTPTSIPAATTTTQVSCYQVVYLHRPGTAAAYGEYCTSTGA